MGETPRSQTVSTKLERVAKLAKQAPGVAITTLAHHIDMEWLREAYRLTRKDGAAGVDGQNAEEYARDLEGNLGSLLARVKSATYRAPSVRRVNIPKGDGRTRPLGIPTFEDKILQRAVVMLLEAVYEQDFLDCSYGFRPGRSAHDALKALRDTTMAMGGGWILEVDIEKFFDTIDHEHLRAALRQRIADGAVHRLIGKWLNAGVLENGQMSRPDVGTPQGGVISPLLANVFLHEVLDVWFHEEVRPKLQGQAVLVRYADDFVIIFKQEDDARRVMDVLPKRFGKYGLTLHPKKTRLIEFTKPPPSEPPGGPAGAGPKTFDLLGFTHFWNLSSKRNWVVMLKTAKDRFTRAAKQARQWCRSNRHLPIEVQCRALNQKLSGHYGYFGVVGNLPALLRLRHEVYSAWRSWLNRRSQRARVTWERMRAIHASHPLASPPRTLRQLRT